MIIGSGLLAHAFAPAFSQSEEVCIYAAGVSNSSCVDPNEFARERQRLTEALREAAPVSLFVYFGTCSVTDPEASETPYVKHKLAMERLVAAHPRHLILRLPQVAGKTHNPHTLLNYLYARVSRSESFCLWKNARRNIIDVDDIVAITSQLIANPAMHNAIINIANPVSYSMPDIVHAMEKSAGKRAIYEITERGSAYPIDVRAMLPALATAGVKFGDDYLERVINKYYGKPD